MELCEVRAVLERARAEYVAGGRSAECGDVAARIAASIPGATVGGGVYQFGECDEFAATAALVAGRHPGVLPFLGHAWVLWRGWLLDVTADQFDEWADERAAPIVCAPVELCRRHRADWSLTAALLRHLG